MNREPPASLGAALDSFRPSQIFLRYDFFIGLAGGVGGLVLALLAPGRISAVVLLIGAVVGVVIGAVIAGVAVLTAFFNESFLRKLRASGHEPVRFMRPFLFTASIGVVGALLLFVLAAIPPKPRGVYGPVAFFGGLCSIWSLASVLPGLDMLVQFVGLQFEAAEFEDPRKVEASAHSSVRSVAPLEPRPKPPTSQDG
jgi:hypothetical protein